MLGYSSEYDKNIYHSLCLGFSQDVSITGVVDCDIFGVVSLLPIHILLDDTCTRYRDAWRGDFAQRVCRLILSVMSFRESKKVLGYSLRLLVGHLDAVCLLWFVFER